MRDGNIKPISPSRKDTAPNAGSGSCPRKRKYDVEQRRKYDVKKKYVVKQRRKYDARKREICMMLNREI